MLSGSLAISIAAVVGVLLPILIIAVHHEIRVRRIRLIDDFRQNFGGRPANGVQHSDAKAEGGDVQSDMAQGASGENPPAGVAESRPNTKGGRSKQNDLEDSPSFEFVVNKYIVDFLEKTTYEDLKKSRTAERDRKSDYESEFLFKLVKEFPLWSLPSNWRLVAASVPYMLAVAAGTLLVLHVIFGVSPICTIVRCGASMDEAVKRLLPLISAGFLGALTFSIKYVIRAVMVSDLNAGTFLRAFAHVLTTIVVVIVFGQVVAFLMGEQVAPKTDLVDPGFWQGAGAAALFLAAFVIGLIPDTGTGYLVAALARSPVFGPMLQYVKQTEPRFASANKSIPLDFIDGIDIATRYRLEEAGIYEVQNLAVYNPILLYVETPYGIYQAIDWIAQAQLCAVAGVERFLLLRQHNIRTIFDLERAVMDIKSTPQLRRIIASILLTPTRTLADVLGDETDLKRGETPVRKKIELAGTMPGVTPGVPFEQTVRELVAQPATFQEIASVTKDGPVTLRQVTDPDGTIKHIVRTMVDDLHVHRLREIWESIGRKLGRDAAHLDENQDALGPTPDNGSPGAVPE